MGFDANWKKNEKQLKIDIQIEIGTIKSTLLISDHKRRMTAFLQVQFCAADEINIFAYIYFANSLLIHLVAFTSSFTHSLIFVVAVQKNKQCLCLYILNRKPFSIRHIETNAEKNMYVNNNNESYASGDGLT